VTVASIPRSGLRDQAIRALNMLPPFSPTLSKLLTTLAKEDVFFGELASIIEKDTVLAGTVLKLVNSALYARSGTINSVRYAISIIGLNKLRNVALGLSVARMWKNMQMPKSWSMAAFNLHSVATAVMADALAQRLNVRYPEGAFTAGLLHAVGKMLIAVGLPQQYEAILLTYQTGNEVTMEEAEFAHVGCCHAELAAAALGQWKLPADIQEAVGNQHHPRPDSGGVMELSRLVFLAHGIIGRMGITIPCCVAKLEGSPEESLQSLGLGDQSARLLEDFNVEFNVMRGFF
jgi:HD-like signal output (HDOD) protein